MPAPKLFPTKVCTAIPKPKQGRNEIKSVEMIACVAACSTIPINPIIAIKLKKPIRINTFWKETGSDILNIAEIIFLSIIKFLKF